MNYWKPFKNIRQNKRGWERGEKGEILLNLEPCLWAKALHSSY